jgi:N-formylglutamate amidohydrolase
MILHIPHASSRIPADERNRLIPDDAALARELLVSTDWFTDELFDVPVRVISIMIEVRRDLYMDETTGQKNEEFKRVYACVISLLNSLAEMQEIAG